MGLTMLHRLLGVHVFEKVVQLASGNWSVQSFMPNSLPCPLAMCVHHSAGLLVMQVQQFAHASTRLAMRAMQPT